MGNNLNIHRPYRYEEARGILRRVIEDFRILSGDQIGPGNSTWQEIAETTEANLRLLADRIGAARTGNTAGGPAVFPSPADLGNKGMIGAITVKEYQDATNDHLGWCTNCLEFTHDSCEPDAHGYVCPKCCESSVMGAEQALLCGMIQVGE
jgi:hypothetical protein